MSTENCLLFTRNVFLCIFAGDPCFTLSYPCHFPFSYKNILRNSCITDDNGNTSWCALTANYNPNSYGNCSASCPGEQFFKHQLQRLVAIFDSKLFCIKHVVFKKQNCFHKTWFFYNFVEIIYAGN